jgi:hypothetical protein
VQTSKLSHCLVLKSNHLNTLNLEPVLVSLQSSVACFHKSQSNVPNFVLVFQVISQYNFHLRLPLCSSLSCPPIFLGTWLSNTVLFIIKPSSSYSVMLSSHCLLVPCIPMGNLKEQRRGSFQGYDYVSKNVSLEVIWGRGC